jgi:hypothetical protein
MLKVHRSAYGILLLQLGLSEKNVNSPVERIEVALFLKVSYCSINVLASWRDLYE